ncbi:uncharacterized protein METZ01_LOCUS377738, partial [marine metagenome]
MPKTKAKPDETLSTVQPFNFSKEFSKKLKDLDLLKTVDHIKEHGYAVMDAGVTEGFNKKLRKTCIRLAQETEGPAKGYAAAILLGRDPIYEEVVLNPRIQAMVEVMCGKGALLSQLIASVRPKGAPEIGLHADQNWTPAPFPVHNQLLTLCWACDEYTKEGGCTKVIPNSHLKRRHPLPKEITKQEGAIPVECPPGSLAMWDGSIWHSNYPRNIEGDRVVIHITFSRLALRTVESYDHLDEKWLKGKPKELATMLGRDDFLGHKDFTKGGA